MPSILNIVASAAAIASVQASGFCNEDCDPSSSTSGYSICTNAVNNGVFADYGMTDAQLTDYCLEMCDDGSRQAHFDESTPGAVWDICAGCDTSVTAGVCTMCSNPSTSGSPGVAFCATPTNRDKTCNLIFADPVSSGADGDEYVGATADAEACRLMVTAARAYATGMAWSTVDGDGDGLGSCYAEYASVSYGNVGTSHYSSCIFDWSEDTATGAPRAASTAGGGNIAEVTEATAAPDDSTPGGTDSTSGGNAGAGSGTGGNTGGNTGPGYRGEAGGAGGGGMGHGHKGKGGSGKGEMGCGKKGASGMQAARAGLSTEGGAALGFGALVVLVAGVLSMTAYKRHKATALDMSDEEEMSALIMTEGAPLLHGDEKKPHVKEALPVMY